MVEFALVLLRSHAGTSNASTSATRIGLRWPALDVPDDGEERSAHPPAARRARRPVAGRDYSLASSRLPRTSRRVRHPSLRSLPGRPSPGAPGLRQDPRCPRNEFPGPRHSRRRPQKGVPTASEARMRKWNVESSDGGALSTMSGGAGRSSGLAPRSWDLRLRSQDACPSGRDGFSRRSTRRFRSWARRPRYSDRLPGHSALSPMLSEGELMPLAKADRAWRSCSIVTRPGLGRRGRETPVGSARERYARPTGPTNRSLS